MGKSTIAHPDSINATFSGQIPSHHGSQSQDGAAANGLLPLWVKVTVLLLSILFSGANLAAAWLNAANIAQRLEFRPADNFSAIAKFITDVSTHQDGSDMVDSRDRLIAATHTFTTFAQFHSAANRRATATFAVAGGLSLVAIGFALFLIGADGAFRLQVQYGRDSRLMLSGAAPGLLCFVAGCVLIAIGATQRAEITTPAMTFESRSAAPAVPPEQFGDLP